MSDSVTGERCARCQQPVEDRRNAHHFHVLHRYNRLLVCPTCWDGSEDGWPLDFEPTLLRVLRENNLAEPVRNKPNGRLPRE